MALGHRKESCLTINGLLKYFSLNRPSAAGSETLAVVSNNCRRVFVLEDLSTQCPIVIQGCRKSSHSSKLCESEDISGLVQKAQAI